MFDQVLGDLFVIRVAGNIVAPSQVGSVEFAAERFGTRLVVVLGHSQCGAILATLEWSLAGVFLDHAMGVISRDESVLYIHAGTGSWGIPFRIGARPEVTIIELRRGPRVALGPLPEVSRT